MAFNKTKYDNDFQKNNYDRIIVNVPKGKREVIKNFSATQGYTSLNAYINDLIKRDMETSDTTLNQKIEINGGNVGNIGNVDTIHVNLNK